MSSGFRIKIFDHRTQEIQNFEPTGCLCFKKLRPTKRENREAWRAFEALILSSYKISLAEIYGYVNLSPPSEFSNLDEMTYNLILNFLKSRDSRRLSCDSCVYKDICSSCRDPVDSSRNNFEEESKENSSESSFSARSTSSIGKIGLKSSSPTSFVAASTVRSHSDDSNDIQSESIGSPYQPNKQLPERYSDKRKIHPLMKPAIKECWSGSPKPLSKLTNGSFTDPLFTSREVPKSGPSTILESIGSERTDKSVEDLPSANSKTDLGIFISDGRENSLSLSTCGYLYDIPSRSDVTSEDDTNIFTSTRINL